MKRISFIHFESLVSFHLSEGESWIAAASDLRANRGNLPLDYWIVNHFKGIRRQKCEHRSLLTYTSYRMRNDSKEAVVQKRGNPAEHFVCYFKDLFLLPSSVSLHLKRQGRNFVSLENKPYKALVVVIQYSF